MQLFLTFFSTYSTSLSQYLCMPSYFVSVNERWSDNCKTSTRLDSFLLTLSSQIKLIKMKFSSSAVMIYRWHWFHHDNPSKSYVFQYQQSWEDLEPNGLRHHFRNLTGCSYIVRGNRAFLSLHGKSPSITSVETRLFWGKINKLKNVFFKIIAPLT